MSKALTSKDHGLVLLKATHTRGPHRLFTYRYIGSTVALCAIFCLTVATAHAQELSNKHSVLALNEVAFGWWSLIATKPKMALHLLNLGDMAHFEAHASSLIATAGTSSYRSTDLTHIPTRNLVRFAPMLNTKARESSSLMQDGSLSPESLFSFVDANYQRWQSRLAEMRSITQVNGGSVYPLIQIDYADMHLPITLYIPPLRGSAAR
jgi:hypothetical protein